MIIPGFYINLLNVDSSFEISCTSKYATPLLF